MTENEILTGAIELFGKQAQEIVAMEEMSELIQALSKNMRGADNRSNISEEIADVEIMLEQLKIIFNNESETRLYKKMKMQRLEAKVFEQHMQQAEGDEI